MQTERRVPRKMEQFTMVPNLFHTCAFPSWVKIVWINLFSRADDNAECWPSIARIASECFGDLSIRRGEQRVKDALKILESHHCIYKFPRFKDGRQCTNLYQINHLDEMTLPAPAKVELPTIEQKNINIPAVNKEAACTISRPQGTQIQAPRGDTFSGPLGDTNLGPELYPSELKPEELKKNKKQMRVLKKQAPVVPETTAPPAPSAPLEKDPFDFDLMPKTYAPEIVSETKLLAEDWLTFANEKLGRQSGFKIENFEKAIEDIKRKEKLNDEAIRRVFEYIQGSEFWSRNAVSPAGLLKRKDANSLSKLQTILLQMNSSKPRASKQQQTIDNNAAAYAAMLAQGHKAVF